MLLEKEAKKLGISEVTTEASITAKEFFEGLGYRCLKKIIKRKME